MLVNFVIKIKILCIWIALVNSDAGTDYNEVNSDGSFSFGLSNNDIGGHYHTASGSPNKIIRGRYGSRNPETGQIEETVYTAGPRGFRARGPTIHRNMDLSQYPRGPIGTPDDPLADPYDDPSYNFGFRTTEHERREEADSTGRVRGLYSYLDDIGERHTVRYAAGAGTGFEVLNSVPDTPASVAYNSPLYKAPRRTRGRMSVQRGPDGQYKFILSGPDQRRSETSGADGIVRGSYSYLDDKGVQRTVEYIAGPGIGYRIVQNLIGPGTHINPGAPIPPNYGDRDFAINDLSDDGLFRTAESGRIRPKDDNLDNGKDTLIQDDKCVQDCVKGVGESGFTKDVGRRIGIVGGRQKPKIGISDEDFKVFDSSFDRKGDKPSITKNKNDNYLPEQRKKIGYDEEGPPSSSFNEKEDVSRTKTPIRGQNNYNAIGLSKEEGYATGYDYGRNKESKTVSSDGYDDKFYDSKTNRPISSRVDGNTERYDDGKYDYKDSFASRRRRPGSKDSTLPSSFGRERVADKKRVDINVSDGNQGRTKIYYNEYESDFPRITNDRRELEINRGRDWSLRGRDSTIIKNVGKWYVGLPPGSSVRAHVQNIDLLPLGGRAEAPSEALLRDELKTT